MCYSSSVTLWCWTAKFFTLTFAISVTNFIFFLYTHKTSTGWRPTRSNIPNRSSDAEFLVLRNRASKSQYFVFLCIFAETLARGAIDRKWRHQSIQWSLFPVNKEFGIEIVVLRKCLLLSAVDRKWRHRSLHRLRFTISGQLKLSSYNEPF
jgi:hypothetical protein